MKTAASISACGRYRWWLTRTWDEALPVVCFVMLNPSTADAEVDDPTIRRCIAFARAWGAGAITVVNLFALRATDPKELMKQQGPVGDENDRHILAEAMHRRVIAAWGTHGKYRQRNAQVVKLLSEHGITIECLGKTRDGSPRHPLYVPAITGPIPL